MIVITVGRLERNKRPHDAINIMRKVQKEIPHIKFIWIGEGTMLTSLQRYVEKEGLSFIQFVGRRSSKEKLWLLKEAKLYISTSEVEGFNVPIGEALLLGLPVVAYDIPVHREVYGNSILYVPCFNEDIFAETIIQILRNLSHYRELVKKGQELMREKYSPEAVAERVERALMEVLKT